MEEQSKCFKKKKNKKTKTLHKVLPVCVCTRMSAAMKEVEREKNRDRDIYIYMYRTWLSVEFIIVCKGRSRITILFNPILLLIPRFWCYWKRTERLFFSSPWYSVIGVYGLTDRRMDGMMDGWMHHHQGCSKLPVLFNQENTKNATTFHRGFLPVKLLLPISRPPGLDVSNRIIVNWHVIFTFAEMAGWVAPSGIFVCLVSFVPVFSAKKLGKKTRMVRNRDNRAVVLHPSHVFRVCVGVYAWGGSI